VLFENCSYFAELQRFARMRSARRPIVANRQYSLPLFRTEGPRRWSLDLWVR